jgi:hypothetical protein
MVMYPATLMRRGADLKAARARTHAQARQVSVRARIKGRLETREPDALLCPRVVVGVPLGHGRLLSCRRKMSRHPHCR